MAGTPGWETSQEGALGYGNLLDASFKTALFDAFAEQPAALRDVLTWFWGDEPDPQLMTALQAKLGKVLRSRRTPGNATALGSMLLMARDSAQYPPYRPTPVEKAARLTGTRPRAPAPRSGTTTCWPCATRCSNRAADYGIELQDRLDAQGLIVAVVYPPGAGGVDRGGPVGFRHLAWRRPTGETPATQRAWLVRGSSVNGKDLVPVWLTRGSASLAASSFVPVDAGMSRDELKPIVDEDYAHTSYARRPRSSTSSMRSCRGCRMGDLSSPLARAPVHRPGDGSARLHAVRGRAVQPAARGQLAHRGQASTTGTSPSDLAGRLQVQRELLDLTQQLPSLEALLRASRSRRRPHSRPRRWCCGERTTTSRGGCTCLARVAPGVHRPARTTGRS